MKKIVMALLISLSFSSQAQRINGELVMKHISFLSSDELGGRGTSTAEEIKAAAYIAREFKGMELQPKGTSAYYYDFDYTYNAKVHDTSTIGLKVKRGRNVLGYIDNGRKETVVIGAHYDHLGYGYDHNSMDPNPIGKIHNGADDNASGVAGVIELARYFSSNGITENYNFLFMTFSGEELGLIGSKKWCENPTYPLSNINYMINLDMIGRYEADKKLLIYGVGTSAEWISNIEKVNKTFAIKYDSAGIGPSDQTSFYLKNIPALHFFTGQHNDYHKPSDDISKVNVAGEAKILELIIDLVYQLDNKPKLGFLKTRDAESTKMSFKVTLGIMPDYIFDGKGLRLDGVSDNKPAAKAGLQAGDIIVQINETNINDIQDYMKLLNTFKKGDNATIIFLRENEKLSTQVEF
ncbi:MAG: M20/M25/M40 family metallo-hydrolase [Bacteroidetes bacterium]|nr:M20/M25/M40 family metallo-hydrolase [Bacteroidota bacterium]